MYWEGEGDGGTGGGFSSDEAKTRSSVAKQEKTKYKAITEQEQHLPVRHTGGPADYKILQKQSRQIPQVLGQLMQWMVESSLGTLEWSPEAPEASVPD